MSNELELQKPAFSLAPQNIEQALRFAELLSKSNLIPKDFVGNPGNILVAVQWGMELGLQPMQAMQNIAVINGRPSLWGDAVIGIVKASPLCEYIVEEVTDEGATCRVKRRGEPEQIRSFSLADAKQAGLLNKPGPWTQYRKRMLQMRARSWALRDVFPDLLRGMPIAEEIMDIEPRDITPPRPQSGAEVAAAAAASSVVESDERTKIIDKLKSAAKKGAEEYKEEWRLLDKRQRHLVGLQEHESLKLIAQQSSIEGSLEESEESGNEPTN